MAIGYGIYRKPCPFRPLQTLMEFNPPASNTELQKVVCSKISYFPATTPPPPPPPGLPPYPLRPPTTPPSLFLWQVSTEAQNFNILSV